MASTIDSLSLFRYRGYFYDAETGLYYLKSRYYDPEVGRFLNADERLNTKDILGCNSYIYCLNSPINMIDQEGKEPISVTLLLIWETIKPGLIGAGVGVAGYTISSLLFGKELTWEETGMAAVIGAVGAYNIGYVALISLTYSFHCSFEEGDSTTVALIQGAIDLMSTCVGFDMGEGIIGNFSSGVFEFGYSLTLDAMSLIVDGVDSSTQSVSNEARVIGPLKHQKIITSEPNRELSPYRIYKQSYPFSPLRKYKPSYVV